MRKRALTATAVGLAAVLALPAVATAKLTEVGLIESTTPATVPSCTTGPLGSVGLEAEKKEKEGEKKKGSGKKSASGHKSSTRRHKRRQAAHASSLRRTAKRDARGVVLRRHALALAGAGGLAAVTPVRDVAHLAATAPTTESATPSTEATEAGEEGEEGTEGSETTTEAPCLAVSRTTGIQSKVGPVKHPLTVPANGRIVAWTIQLGRPTASQIKFFDENEGGAASAGIAVLSPVKTKSKSTPTYHLLAQSGILKLEPYFGLTVQFPLAKTIKVKKGDVIALTVPSWAPALALGFGKNTSWRASRQKGQCSTTSSQTAQTELKSNLSYYCMYQTARLTYSATLISTP